MKTLAVIGTGLIGCSFAAALKAKSPSIKVLGFDANLSQAQAALHAGVIDTIAPDLMTVAQADVLLIAVPVRALPEVLQGIANHLPSTSLVMDVGSTKSDALAHQKLLGNKRGQFVPAHPIAGREKSGAFAAEASLFQGKHVILTPSSETASDKVAQATELWQATGARVLQMSAAEHDQIFAAVSHLPHILAFALVNEFAQRDNANTLFQFAASGFRDFTRIAASSPQMWRDIALNNRDALLDEMKRYQSALTRWIDCVERGDSTQLASMMATSKDHRERWGKGEFEK
jgi:prephenate dehydrogenase